MGCYPEAPGQAQEVGLGNIMRCNKTKEGHGAVEARPKTVSLEPSWFWNPDNHHS